ncbi:hypothetical protein CALCODRAFT_307963 [Calocera cornea HHB12733]|uniref:C2H2-type domain-containing protein n=1 Tax=Calocera cornea HHB12733 TaxID=1353952 RepID=A0A165JNE2_9BASI|nr:hypothetical protein CALCODRAFT_307963 [Calocera cornea HHB12733]
MSSFTVRSSARGIVSLLNDDDLPPLPNITPCRLSTTQTTVEVEDGYSKPLAKRQYDCQTCGKIFTTAGHLTRHEKIHTGVKEFECPWPDCAKKTTRHDNLLQHYRVHLPKSSQKSEPSLVRIYLQEMCARVQQAGEVDNHEGISGGHEASPDIALPGMPNVRQPSLVDPGLGKKHLGLTIRTSHCDTRIVDNASTPILQTSSRNSVATLQEDASTPLRSPAHPEDRRTGSLADSKPSPDLDNYLWPPSSERSPFTVSYMRGE